ncbi:MAG: hypothetical protein WA830_25400 [Candidatus Sulfotelmatobacter sp.]
MPRFAFPGCVPGVVAVGGGGGMAVVFLFWATAAAQQATSTIANFTAMLSSLG